ncbi:conserved hypothetical protein, partial [delta proteobacterium NaphS2]
MANIVGKTWKDFLTARSIPIPISCTNATDRRMILMRRKMDEQLLFSEGFDVI